MANATNQAAQAEYFNQARRASAALEALQALHAEQLSAQRPNGGDVDTNWGHVGSMEHLADQLEDLCKLLRGEDR